MGAVRLELHDANVTDPVKGRMSSPTHAGTAHVDYEYQAEEMVREIERDYPFIVRCALENGREWQRIDGRFVEVKR